VAKSTFPIYWGHISVLEADLVCLNLLYNENKGKSNLKNFLRPGVITKISNF
jgi:hypothetical protein